MNSTNFFHRGHASVARPPHSGKFYHVYVRHGRDNVAQPSPRDRRHCDSLRIQSVLSYYRPLLHPRLTSFVTLHCSEEGVPGRMSGYPGGGYPGQQPGGYPGQQQPGGYPGGQPGGGYPGQQPGGYPGGQPGGGYPGSAPPRPGAPTGGYPGGQPQVGYKGCIPLSSLWCNFT